MWELLRYGASDHKLWPRFIGFVKQLFQKQQSATILTYLPPIQTPITEYRTIVEIFVSSQNLARTMNMLYVHITLDVGAAIKAFHILWNDTDRWKDIIIHLGDFLAVMVFLGVIGQYVTGSGFEEIAYQSELTTAGSIEKLLSGKHYNRCWWVHEILHDALERLFLKRFLQHSEDEIRKLQENSEPKDIKESLRCEEVRKLIIKYQAMKKKGINGQFGKTPQFWLKYMEMVTKLHQLHFALNTNNLLLKINSCE